MDAYDCRLPLGGILSIHETPEQLYGLDNVIRVKIEIVVKSK